MVCTLSSAHCMGWSGTDGAGKVPSVVCHFKYTLQPASFHCAYNNVPLWHFSLRSPPASSCRTSVSVLTSFWARLWRRGKPRLYLYDEHWAGGWGGGRVAVRFTWQSLRRHGYDPDPRRITHMRMVWAFLGILHRVKSRLMGCESSSNRDLEAEVVFRKACKACTALFTWHRHRGFRFKTPSFFLNTTFNSTLWRVGVAVPRLAS